MTSPRPEPHGRFEPDTWRALGFPEDEAREWWEHRITPESALAWRRAQVTEPLDAVRWSIAGVGPGRVAAWLGAGIGAREAVGWTELGFDAQTARAHKRAGRNAAQAFGHRHAAGAAATGPGAVLRPAGGPGSVSRAGPARFHEIVRRSHPRVVHSYMADRWFDDEAIAWASYGIEAADARAWKELGLTPPEAQRLHAQGLTAMQTAIAWWRAGIPVDEVPDWIGAGLGPAEAAAQRAKGVTAERAAILRSLRKQK